MNAASSEADDHRRFSTSLLAKSAWAAVVLIIIAGVYAMTVAERVDQARAHSLRSLEQTAQAVEQLLSNATNTLGSLNERPEYACEFFKQQQRLTLIKPADCADVREIVLRDTQLRVNAANSTAQLEGFFVAPKVNSDTQEVEKKTAEPEVTTPNTETRKKKKARKDLVINIRLDQVLNDAPFGDTFDSILVADSDGLVIAQHRPTVSSLFEPPGKVTDQALLAVRIKNINTLPAMNAVNSAAGDVARTDNATAVSKVLVAGSTWRLMCHPLRLDLDQLQLNSSRKESNDTENWRLCGIEGTERSFRQALEVASPLVIAMFTVAILGIFAWPIFKVLAVAPRERLRFLDTYFVLFATGGMLLVGATAALHVDTTAAILERSELRLQKLARELEDNLLTELELMHDQLQDYDRKLSRVIGNNEITELFDQDEYAVEDRRNGAGQRFLEATNILAPAKAEVQNALDTLDNNNAKVRRVLSRPTIYPFLNSAYWMRPCDGQQFIKATTKMSNTPAVSLKTREYFDAVKKNQLWDVGKRRYTVQTFASITTGEFSSALSIKSLFNTWTVADLGAISHECDEEKNASVAAALSARPLSMTYPVLAPGVGFAIVDANGKAIFHSDERRATLENLLDDEGIAERLRAALVAHADVKFSANYQAKSHQLYVMPMRDLPWSLQGMPWSIVTFVDEEIIRTASFEALARSVILMSIYLLLCAAATFIYLLLHGRVTPRWLWPLAHLATTQRSQIYPEMLRFLAAFALVFTLALQTLTGDMLMLASLAAPALLLIIVIGGYSLVTRTRISVKSVRQLTWTTVTLLTVAALCWQLLRPEAERTMFGMLLIVLLAGVWALRPWPAFTWSRLASFAPDTFKLASDPLTAYMRCSMLLWIILAVLPAYGFYKLASHGEMNRLADLEEEYIGRALTQRAFNLENDYRNVNVPDRCKFIGDLNSRFGVYNASLSPQAGFDPHSIADKKLRGTAVTKTLWDAISYYQPLYNDTTTYARHAESRRLLEIPAAHNPRACPAPNTAGDARRALTKPLAATVVTPQLGLTVLFAAAAALAMLWSWVGFGARRLLFGELAVAAEEGLRTDDLIHQRITKHTIAVLASPLQYQWLLDDNSHHQIIDLRSAWLTPEISVDNAQPFFCIHLEELINHLEQQEALLVFLERLVKTSRHKLLVVATLDPAELLQAVNPEKARLEGAEQAREEGTETGLRWHQLLSQFNVRHVAITGTLDAGIADRRSLLQAPDDQWIQQETGAIYGLHALLAAGPLDSLTKYENRREALEAILTVAEPYYNSLWAQCSTDEKLVLFQLEQERVANPKQVAAVRHLLRRGLVRMDPVLRPINHSFGLFIARKPEPSEMRMMEKELPRWANIRSMLFGIVLIILLFLWFTQRDVVESWIAYVGAIAVGISGLLKIIGSLRDGLDASR